MSFEANGLKIVLTRVSAAIDEMKEIETELAELRSNIFYR